MREPTPYARSILFLVALLCAGGCGSPPAADRTTTPSPPVDDLAAPALPDGFQRGMNLEPIGGFSGPLDRDRLPASLDVLAELGIDHVALIPSFFQRRLEDTAFIWRGGRSRVDADTRSAIRLARERGMRVLLKPHLWLEDRSSGAWRGDILPAAEDWPAWSRAYRDAVLAYARMAAEENVAAISIGSELTALALARPDFWRRLATDVRQAFPGRVTYAANWDREFREIDWWDAVDSIGVDAFWPLTDSADEDLEPERCRERLGAVRRQLGDLSRRRRRPVLLTEIGYRSARGAAWRPWEWHGDDDQPPDPRVQARAYRCIAEVFGPVAAAAPRSRREGAGRPTGGSGWLTGVYFWVWQADLDWGGPANADFTPRDKPAEAILAAWFNRRSPPPPVP